MRNNKVRLRWDCAFGKCPIGSDPDYDCAYLCLRCKLYTADGMIITKVRNKKNNIIYNVAHTSGDEFIFYSDDTEDLISTVADIDKFNECFDIVETECDYRGRAKY